MNWHKVLGLLMVGLGFGLIAGLFNPIPFCLTSNVCLVPTFLGNVNAGIGMFLLILGSIFIFFSGRMKVGEVEI